MGPLTFLNGAFLVGLGAAALPVLIHLLSRRRARDLPFSHTAFLDEITRRKVRRMRLRQWLLLLLRTLAVACIALALSQPVWHGPGARAQRGSSTIAILIDDSFSMEARLDAREILPVDAARSGMVVATRFEEARQRALQLVDLLQQGDRALLVFLAAPVRIPYESTVRDPSLLQEELQRARPRASRADLIGACERIFPLLASAKTLNREIFIISDFQRNQVREILQTYGARAQAGGAHASTAELGGAQPVAPSAEGRAAADSVRRAAASLLPVPPSTRLYLLPVRAAVADNVALARAFFERDATAGGGRLTLQARNLGRRPVAQASVQVLRGDEQGDLLAEGFLNLEPEGFTQSVIVIPAQLAPDELLTTRCAPDLLERDNVRYLSTASASRFRIMVVIGGPLSDPQVREEARFLLLALDPLHAAQLLAGEGGAGDRVRDEGAVAAGVAADDPRLFEIATVTEADLGLTPRIDADAVILLNVGRLSPAATELLDHFHAEGGGILIVCGDRVDPRTYNTQILPGLGAMRLSNIAGEEEGDVYFSLRPAAVGHPLFDGFPLAPGQALSGARFRHYLETRPGPQARVLAEFSGGGPALLEEPGLMLFTSALDLRWSDFPTSASYLPFLHRILLHLVRTGRMAGYDPLVGDLLTWPLPRELAQAALRCQGPGGIELPVIVSQTDRGPVLVTEPVADPGFYRLVAEGGRGLPAVAVNVDTRESELEPMTAEEGTLLFGTDAARLAPDAELSRQVLEARFGRELWRLLLALAFLLLVAETLIARGRALA